MTAVFSGPNKKQQTVNGFWNGSNSFIIRFAPDAEGTWTYVTQSTDIGLNNQKGSFQCTKALDGQHGFLRHDETFRYHFIWDDGSRYFLMGQTYYSIMANAMAGDRWKAAIDGSRQWGINKVRMMVNAKKTASKVAYPSSSIFTDTTLNNLNVPYLQKLDQVISYMQSKGMVADLILLSAYGTIAQDERYVRYIIARYAAYTNVMWCLVRLLSVHHQTRIDFQFFNQDWPTHAIIQYGVRNGQNVQGDEWSKEQNKAKYKQGDEWGNKGIIYNLGHDIPVVNDEFGYIGEPDDRTVNKGKPDSKPVPLTRKKHRQILWGIYTAGGYGSVGDKYQYYNNGKATTEKYDPALGENDGMPYFSTNWHKPDEYEDIKHVVDFFTTKGLQYWKMAAHNELITSGERVYALAEPGKQYVIYAAIGGRFSITLLPGNYMAYLYHPSTGKTEKIRKVKGGTMGLFTLPSGDDAVVYLLVEENKENKS